MIKIKSLDFIEILLKKFSKYNVNKIFIAAGYRGKKIYKKYHKKRINLIDIECILEKNFRYGVQLVNLKAGQQRIFCDKWRYFFDVNLNSIYEKNKNQNKIYIPLSNSNNYKSNKKLTNLSVLNKRIRFDKKSRYFNGGIYFFNDSIFKKIPQDNFSLENDLLKFEIKKKCNR